MRISTLGDVDNFLRIDWTGDDDAKDITSSSREQPPLVSSILQPQSPPSYPSPISPAAAAAAAGNQAVA